MITIIDYGMGNIGSLENMIRRLGGDVNTADSPDGIAKAEKMILPGVGHFGNAMQQLHQLDLIDAMNKKVLNEKIPILCICLGAQLIMRKSEEGNCKGLGWIEGEVIRFHFSENSNLKIPHMGCNTLKIKKMQPLFKLLPESPRFYFVHSFHLLCDHDEDIAATSIYGYEFVASVQHNNIFATQFHPEKSHKFGMQLMKNFLEM